MAVMHNMGMAHIEKQEPQVRVGSSFSDYARQVEADLEPEARQVLERLSRNYSIAAELLELRKQHGMTQIELANASGVNQSEISRIENGTANPSQETLDAIGKVWGLRLGFVPVPDDRVAITR